MKQRNKQSNQVSNKTIWVGIIITIVIIVLGIAIKYPSTSIDRNPSETDKPKMAPKTNPPVLYNK